FDWKNHFYTSAQVAVHPVGRANVDLRLTGIVEVEHPAVLEEAIDNRGHANVVANAGHSGPQRTNAAANKIDAYARLARPVNCLDDGRLQQTVDLCNNPPRFSRELICRLLLDPLKHETLQTARRHDELLPLRQLGIAGEVVEKGRGIFAKFGPAREETKVGI